MHGDRSAGDVGHWGEVRSVNLADRYRGGDAVKDLKADRFVGDLCERLHLREGDGAQVESALGRLCETNDADAEAEVAGLAILLHKAAALEGREESAHR